MTIAQKDYKVKNVWLTWQWFMLRIAYFLYLSLQESGLKFLRKTYCKFVAVLEQNYG